MSILKILCQKSTGQKCNRLSSQHFNKSTITKRQHDTSSWKMLSKRVPWNIAVQTKESIKVQTGSVQFEVICLFSCH